MPTLWGHSDETLHNIVTTTSTTSPPVPEDETGTTSQPDSETAEKEAA
ncbi:MAG: hypothetical protein H5U08_03955 [Thermogutta sp.]|nr:hypothetical protein [Thermogutta sp.]MBC7351492.1 hypothetical protein [Thermogutta sp.]